MKLEKKTECNNKNKKCFYYLLCIETFETLYIILNTYVIQDVAKYHHFIFRKSLKKVHKDLFKFIGISIQRMPNLKKNGIIKHGLFI